MSKCKEYQVNSEIVKCSEDKHSVHCLEEQKLKREYPSAKEVIWKVEKQNWMISFMEVDKSLKAKKDKEEEKTEVSDE